MSRVAQSSPNKDNDPNALPESERSYYREKWGFDPVTDRRKSTRGRFWYGECFPLPQDPPLQNVGITICARVYWRGEDIHNRIVFQRKDAKGRWRKASVACTHTVVFVGSVGDALNLAEGNNFEQVGHENSTRILRSVTLPPWEHFAALKSFVAAVSDMGVITLLRESILASSASEDGLPFGFNSEMLKQVTRALFTIAPRAMASTYRDLTCEFLDTRPPATQVKRWMDQSVIFRSDAKHEHWGFLLCHLDVPALIYLFRHTGLFDVLQNHLFTKPALLAKARAVAPDLPWDILNLEWEARRAAEHPHRLRELNNSPPVEVWARVPFCDYTFPRDILTPDTTDLRRSRVQACLCEMRKAYGPHPTLDLDYLSDDQFAEFHLDWADYITSNLDSVLAKPFPADYVRPKPECHWDATNKQYVPLTPTQVTDFIVHGKHEERRKVVLTSPVPPELQENLATHWDFATRLALIGNPGTMPAVLATLAQDAQPCVRFAAEARVRRGTAYCEPLFGEIIDPGELVWLLSSHPGIEFRFGVTTWGDGSEAYRDWFDAHLREIQDKENHWILGELHIWAYDEGIFLETAEPKPDKSHLALHGLTPYACGHLPCLFLSTVKI